MIALLAVYAAMFGLVIGSFLNVVVYRVPAGLSVVSPGSACPGCKNEIVWYDNLPVISWVLLRAKCRGCKEPISARYPIVEASTGVLFVILTLAAPHVSAAPLLCLVGAACLALAIIDFETMRLPDPIVAWAAGLAVLGVLVDGFVEGDWPVGRAAFSALVWGLVFGIPWLASTGRAMGFGDVKLAPVLGLTLGWLGWGESLVGLAAGFSLGALIGVGLIMFAGHGKRKHIPFGPFMVAGALVGVLFGHDLWHLYLDTFFPAI